MRPSQLWKTARSPMAPPNRLRTLAVAACVVLLLLPLVMKSGYFIHIMIMIALYAYLGVAWNVLGGFAGQMSIGHCVFLGLGAYASTILCVRLGLNPWLAMLAAAVGTAVVGSMLGYLLFRLRDAFFALSTMALLRVVTLLAVYLRGLTNGNLGMALPIQKSITQMAFANKASYFYLAAALLILATAAAAKIRYSKFGLRLLAIRDDHAAAESVGIDTHWAKVLALGVSALLVSMGGSFFAHYVLYIDPATVFDPKIGLQMPLVAILGGLGTITGPILGSVLMTPADAILRARFGGQIAGLNFLIYGLILMVVVRFFPQGIIPKLSGDSLAVRRRGKRAAQQAAQAAAEPNHRSVAPAEPRANTILESPDRSVLDINDLTVQFGGLTAVKSLNLRVAKGEILGLIGPNGAGKTTVFNAITGYVRPTAGTIAFSGKELPRRTKPHRLCHQGLTRTFQIVRPFKKMTLLENVMTGTMLRAGSYAEAENRAYEILQTLGLAEQAESYPGSLTIVGQKRLELARALAVRPTLLMLDEPMAGLNPNEVEDMVAFVRRLTSDGTSIIIIEHVMNAIMSLCDRLIVLDHGEQIAEGTPTEVSGNQKVIDVYLGERYHA